MQSYNDRNREAVEAEAGEERIIQCPDCGESFTMPGGHACPPTREWSGAWYTPGRWAEDD